MPKPKRPLPTVRRGETKRSRDLVAAGVSRTKVSRLVKQGQLVRIARGIYMRADDEPSEQAALVAVATRAPRVVFCLLTALRLHGLTTQAPFEVWIAIENKEHPPRLGYPPLRTMRFSAASLRAGIEQRTIDGVQIKLTNPAKTVADCFKFRNKIGLDVALEALREWRRSSSSSMDDLWRYARINRIANVVRPYLESIG